MKDGLVQKQITVTRNGKTFLQNVWVKPTESNPALDGVKPKEQESEAMTDKVFYKKWGIAPFLSDLSEKVGDKNFYAMANDFEKYVRVTQLSSIESLKNGNEFKKEDLDKVADAIKNERVAIAGDVRDVLKYLGYTSSYSYFGGLDTTNWNPKQLFTSELRKRHEEAIKNVESDFDSDKFDKLEKTNKPSALEYLKSCGITWEEHSHAAINWMRAKVAMQKSNGTYQPKVPARKNSGDTSKTKLSGEDYLRELKAKGVTWEENKHPAINLMRAKMAEKKFNENLVEADGGKPTSNNVHSPSIVTDKFGGVKEGQEIYRFHYKYIVKKITEDYVLALEEGKPDNGHYVVFNESDMKEINENREYFMSRYQRNKDYNAKVEKEQQDYDAQKEAELEKYNDLKGYGDWMKPMDLARARRQLNKPIRYNGDEYTIKGLYEKLVGEGYEPGKFRGRDILINKVNNNFIDIEKDSVTALGYAKHLHNLRTNRDRKKFGVDSVQYIDAKNTSESFPLEAEYQRKELLKSMLTSLVNDHKIDVDADKLSKFYAERGKLSVGSCSLEDFPGDEGNYHPSVKYTKVSLKPYKADRRTFESKLKTIFHEVTHITATGKATYFGDFEEALAELNAVGMMYALNTECDKLEISYAPQVIQALIQLNKSKQFEDCGTFLQVAKKFHHMFEDVGYDRLELLKKIPQLSELTKRYYKRCQVTGGSFLDKLERRDFIRDNLSVITSHPQGFRKYCSMLMERFSISDGVAREDLEKLIQKTLDGDFDISNHFISIACFNWVCVSGNAIKLPGGED